MDSRYRAVHTVLQFTDIRVKAAFLLNLLGTLSLFTSINLCKVSDTLSSFRGCEQVSLLPIWHYVKQQLFYSISSLSSIEKFHFAPFFYTRFGQIVSIL